MGESLINVEGLGFTYSESVEGIQSINFSAEAGEVILLTGNSGSGKSTLLKCLKGLIPEITEGELKGKITLRGE